MNIMPDASLYTYTPNWSWKDTQQEDFVSMQLFLK